MQELPGFVPAFSQHLKPLMRDGSQFTFMLLHPRIDGGIVFDSAVESQQVRFHRASLKAKALQIVRHREDVSMGVMEAEGQDRGLPPSAKSAEDGAPGTRLVARNVRNYVDSS